MEGIFTLPYSEYEVIIQLQKYFKKKDGFAFYLPVSRQQEGIDFIIHNVKKNKFIRMQVKSSRSYEHSPKINKKGDIKNIPLKYHLWFNNFIEKANKCSVDYYILFGLFNIYSQKNKNIKSKTDFWKTVLLCFSEKEMKNFLNNVKTKKEMKTDKFFSLAFNTENEIFGFRGFKKPVNITNNLLKNKISEIRK